MRVLITGADGLLGSNLVRILLDRGDEPVALQQAGRDPLTLKGLDIEICPGDLLDEDSLRKAMQTRPEAVIHCAASTQIWPARDPFIWQVNMNGTRNIVQAALGADIQRFVHVGTANSYGPGSKQEPGTEENVYSGAHYGLDYMDSKVAAQQYILDQVQRQQFPALIVNPTFLMGPFDSLPNGGAMLLAIHSGSARGYASGGRNFVDARDVATGAANALRMGSLGEGYILGNENLNYGEAFSLMAEVVGTRPPRREVPAPLIRTVGRLGTLWGKVSGRRPLISSEMARISCDDHYYSPAKARRELELPATPIKQAMLDCWEWMRSNAMVST